MAAVDRVDCPTCEGSGEKAGTASKHWPENAPCVTCSGTGEINPTALRVPVVRMPDSQGWWARVSSNRTEWFFVETFSDAPPSIWVEALEEHVPVEKFTKPLMRWAGPVTFDGDTA